MTDQNTPVQRAAQIILGGGVVAYPTDTFYGLGCDPRNPDAVTRLFAAKARDAWRASPLIGASVDQLAAAVELSDLAVRLGNTFWPGPLSLVLPARTVLWPAVLGGGTTAAVRVPAEPMARALAETVGFCITATSANLSGEPAVSRARDLRPELVAQLGIVLDAGDTRGGAASTIVDLTGAEPKLLRSGAIAWDRVLESLR
jgi:L-threonylcarbamoyladenylate synthase